MPPSRYGIEGTTEDEYVPPVFTTEILDGHFIPYFQGQYYKSKVKYGLYPLLTQHDRKLVLSPEQVNQYAKHIALVLEKMPRDIAITNVLNAHAREGLIGC